jgi:outer membrane protein TolC
VLADTSALAVWSNRVEYQQLQTQLRMLEANVRYVKWSWLPAASIFGSYNIAAQSDGLSNLYRRLFPNSLAGITVSVPIFQGNKTKLQLQLARLQVQRAGWDVLNLKAAINAEYSTALAEYRAALANYNTATSNLSLATDVYNTVRLQYRSGVKTYLDVIGAETDLRGAEINRLNAIFNLLSSRLDMQKAEGTLHY